jgi:hypothetical protein
MTAPLFDREAAGEFLDFLYADHEGWACLATSDGRWRQDFFRWPNEREALLDVAEGRAPRADVYIGMLPYSAKVRSKATALPGHVAWADVDHALTPQQEAKIRSLPLRIVASGTPGHSHIYVEMSHRQEPDLLEYRNRYLAEQVGGDAKWDASTVLRLPGTFNHKGGNLRPVGSVARVPQ